MIHILTQHFPQIQRVIVGFAKILTNVRMVNIVAVLKNLVTIIEPPIVA